MSTEDESQLSIKKEPGIENLTTSIITTTSNIITLSNVINPDTSDSIITVQSSIPNNNVPAPPIEVVTNQVLVKNENQITSLVPVTSYKPAPITLNTTATTNVTQLLIKPTTINSFTSTTTADKAVSIAVNVAPICTLATVQQTTTTVNNNTTSTTANLGSKSTSNSINQINGETSSNEDNEKTSSVVVLNKQRLQELVAEIDGNEQLDEDVEDMLLNIADDFIDNLVSNACLLAKHRGSKNVEVKDVQLILEKNYNMYIPGFGSLPLNEEFKNVYKKSPATEAHKQRMALIKKTLKKF